MRTDVCGKILLKKYMAPTNKPRTMARAKIILKNEGRMATESIILQSLRMFTKFSRQAIDSFVYFNLFTRSAGETTSVNRTPNFSFTTTTSPLAINL